MKATRLACALLLLLALALSGCAEPTPTGPSKAQLEKQAAEAKKKESEAKFASAEKLHNAGKYDDAMDAYVSIASSEADSETAGRAVTLASLALTRKVEDFRLPGQLDALLKLYGRLPGGKRPEAANEFCADFLLDPVADEANVAEEMLADRRKFIKDLRDEGEGNVLLTPDKERTLTAAEAKDAVSHIDELGMPKEYKDLYTAVVPLATTMDQFLRDDAVRLNNKSVTDSDIRAIERSCDKLAESLWPVARHLDRLKPGWRKGY